jgi:hypothetical protein
MITDDIELLQEIFSIIDDNLSKKGYEYIGFSFTQYRYEDLGMRTDSIEVTDAVKTHTDVSVDSSELRPKLSTLHEKMKARGEDWKSLTIGFVDGEVKTNFSYEENPTP